MTLKKGDKINLYYKASTFYASDVLNGDPIATGDLSVNNGTASGVYQGITLYYDANVKNGIYYVNLSSDKSYDGNTHIFVANINNTPPIETVADVANAWHTYLPDRSIPIMYMKPMGYPDAIFTVSNLISNSNNNSNSNSNSNSSSTTSSTTTNSKIDKIQSPNMISILTNYLYTYKNILIVIIAIIILFLIFYRR